MSLRPRSERHDSGLFNGAKDGEYVDEQSRSTLTYKSVCGKCGARRVDDQMGLEEVCDCLGWATGKPCGKCYVCHSVEVCAEIYRVLRDDGTLWWNVGDSYTGAKPGRNDVDRMYGADSQAKGLEAKVSLPSGNLTGVPWRVALALQALGWVLRSDVIWYKPNAMPESVTTRCSKAHEHIFMFAKSMDYYFDHEAIKVVAAYGTDLGVLRARQVEDTGLVAGVITQTIKDRPAAGVDSRVGNPSGKANKRDVWTVPTQGYAGAHFACYSPKLIEPCILAGTSERGCCARCGAPWERVVEKSGAVDAETKIDRSLGNSNGLPGSGSTLNAGGGVVPTTTTVGWEPGCECNGDFVTTRELVVVVKRVDADVDNFDRDHSLVSNRSGKDSTTLDPGVETVEVEEWQNVTRYVPRVPMADHPVKPCVVLDPFVGSGTTVATAISLGRVGVGVDLSEVYLREHAVPRIRAAIGDRQRAMVEAGVTEPPAIGELVDAAPVRAVVVQQRSRPAPRIVG